jgi:NADH:ubiquinone oxidoreductase subunit K
MGVSIYIFLLGFLGIVVNRKNIINIIISVEIILLACNFNLLYVASNIDDLFGSVFAMFNLALAGAEVVIGLCLVITAYRMYDNLSLLNLRNIKS